MPALNTSDPATAPSLPWGDGIPTAEAHVPAAACFFSIGTESSNKGIPVTDKQSGTVFVVFQQVFKGLLSDILLVEFRPPVPATAAVTIEQYPGLPTAFVAEV